MPSGPVVEVLVSEDCVPCRQATRLWQPLCRELGIAYRCIDISSPKGTILTHGAKLSTLPAVFINETLMAVGVQSRTQAIALLISAGCIDRDPEP